VYLFAENLYQKLPILAILGAVSLHFQSDNGEIWREGTDLDTLPALNFVKNCLGGFVPWGKFFTKNSKFSRFLNRNSTLKNIWLKMKIYV